MGLHPSNEELAEMARLLTKARVENWMGEDFGSWRWWTLVMLLIVPWLIWYKLANKKHLRHLALFGMIVMVFAITLDELGFVLSLWSYPVDVIPMFPRLTSVDYTVVPIVFTLLYQYFPTWRSFFWALVATAAIFSFIIEPLIVWMGFYKLLKWTHWASFLVYIIMGLLSRWIVRMFTDIEQKNSNT